MIDIDKAALASSMAQTASAASGTIAGVELFHEEVMTGLFAMRWATLCIVMLVLTDFWTGCTASIRIHHDEFHKSRAIRRTAAKFGEYVWFQILGIVLFYTFFSPLGLGTPTHGAAIAALLAVYCEADSIYEHLCDIHGWRKRFSVKDFIISFIKRKSGDVGEALDDAMGEERASEKKD